MPTLRKLGATRLRSSPAKAAYYSNPVLVVRVGQARSLSRQDAHPTNQLGLL